MTTKVTNPFGPKKVANPFDKDKVEEPQSNLNNQIINHNEKVIPHLKKVIKKKKQNLLHIAIQQILIMIKKEKSY